LQFIPERYTLEHVFLKAFGVSLRLLLGGDSGGEVGGQFA
jgi:hypothetical protein